MSQLAQTHLIGNILTPHGFVQGQLSFHRCISNLEPFANNQPASSNGLRQPGDNEELVTILPGFIDVHVHGGAGSDTMDKADDIRTLARFHAQHGTTTLLPTTITNPFDNILHALHTVKTVQETQKKQSDPSLPDIPGVHLEGPFISSQQLGAQPNHTLEPTPNHVRRVLEPGVVRVVTLAPEVPLVLNSIPAFVEAGVRLSIGHTRASFAQCQQFITQTQQAGGTVSFTHLYNAMGGLQGREPGVVGSSLATPTTYTEIIYDTHHVHQGSFLSAYYAKRQTLMLITDAMRAAGLGDGESELGGQRVLVQKGQARLESGSLAGSVLTLDVALRNALAAGLSLMEISPLLSRNPARYLGLHDRGEIVIGQRADLVVLNQNQEITAVYVAGQPLTID